MSYSRPNCPTRDCLARARSLYHRPGGRFDSIDHLWECPKCGVLFISHYPETPGKRIIARPEHFEPKAALCPAENCREVIYRGPELGFWDRLPHVAKTHFQQEHPDELHLGMTAGLYADLEFIPASEIEQEAEAE